MLETFGKLLPFILAGAFVPTWTSKVVILLETDRPVGNGTGYVLGNLAWRMILGTAALFFVRVTAPEASERGITMPVGVAYSIAGVLIALGLYLIARRPKTETGMDQDMPGWLKAFKKLPVWATFLYGGFNCALPGVQYVYFLGGIGVIASSRLAWEVQFVYLLVFSLLLQAMLVTPIAIYVWQRKRAEAIFGKIDSWLAKNGSTVVGLILSGIGGLFVYIGLSGGHVGG